MRAAGLPILNRLRVPSVPSGVLWTGLTAGQWSNITARASVIGDTLASGAQAAIAAIPTSGGITIGPSSDLRATISANSRIFLDEGNYTVTAGGRLNLLSKELIGISGAVVTINLANCTTSTFSETIRLSSAKLVNVRLTNAPSVCLNNLGSSLLYNVSVDKTGHQLSQAAVGRGILYTGSGSRTISCQFVNGFSHAAGTYNDGTYGAANAGGEADGVVVGNTGGSNFFADVHCERNSDDGWDFWDADGSQWLYYCTADYNAFNEFFPASDQFGDGNGFKFGIGSVGHHTYICDASNNRTYAYNRNSNTVAPRLKTSTGSSNGLGLYAGGSSLYTIEA